jgi:uncharacterized protein
MPSPTLLTLTEKLPLTCSRSGTCCHGKMVWLNPWELACLAEAKACSSREFRDRFCDFGGIRLKFNGPAGWKGLLACSQYRPDEGCSVHQGRPLACRLFPLGRERQNETHHYMHQGYDFPCLEGCPEVLDLPQMSVGDYITGQATAQGEVAHDRYLEFMQDIADGAFVLLLESGLAESGDRETLRLWRTMGNETPEALAHRLGETWLDSLLLPELSGLDSLLLPELSGKALDPLDYINRHHEKFQSTVQQCFGATEGAKALSEASGLMMGMALHLSRGLGANPSSLVERWIATAKQHGALE